MLSIHRVGAMVRKEVRHILRDPFTMGMALGVPVLLVLLFGTAFEFNLDHIPLAVVDADKSQASRQLIEAFASSEHFKVQPSSGAPDALERLDRGDARAALIIDPGFEKALGHASQAEVQVLVDGSDSASASSVVAYLPLVQQKAQQKILGVAAAERLVIQTRFQFNPELRTQWFMVPGLGVVIIAVLSILLTSLTVAREWENGSMELLLATPVTPVEIILGKLLPYLLLGLGGVSFVYMIARSVFAVPFVGSHLLYLLGCVLFLACGMLQGILISVLTRVQQVAMQAAMISGLLPSIYLSGFIYPIEHMPRAFQYLTLVLPSRWFMKISRDLYLKGSSLDELASSYLALCCISIVLLLIASHKFKRDLEP